MEFSGGFVRQQLLTNTEGLELMYENQVAQHLFYKVGFQSALFLVIDVIFQKNFNFCLPSNAFSTSLTT